MEKGKIEFAIKALILSEGKYLALHKSITRHNFYELPGGRMVFGETAEEALKREVKEETNFIVEPIKLLDTWNSIANDHQITGIIYLCKIKEGSLKLSDEHDKYEWLGLNEENISRMHKVYRERMINWDVNKVLIEFQERFSQDEVITEGPNGNICKDKTELDFNKEKKEFFELIKDKKVMSLATSYNNRVTARSMSCVIFNEKIYFQTDRGFLKYYQIVKNPNVALSVDNIQIEGVAKIVGHPLTEENKNFAEKFKEYYPSSYKNYTHMQYEVVVEVELKLITLWKYIDGKPLRDFLDFREEKAYRDYYDNSK